MICHAFHIGGWIGERVHRTSIYANLPVHAGLAHLFFKRRHLSEGHYGVHRAVADKDLAPDIASIIRLRAGQSPWKLTTPTRGAPLRANSSAVVPPKQ